MLASIWLAGALVLAAQAAPPPSRGQAPSGSAPAQQSPPAQPASPCATAASARIDGSVAELCAGEDEARAAAAAGPANESERTRRLEAAAAHYRRAANLAASHDVSVLALDALATMFDTTHLNRPGDLEQVLRELIASTPDDFEPVYRLAAFQEEQGLIDAAEMTLLDARHRQPDTEEPNRRLAQFYARRVTALHTRDLQTPPGTVSNPGEPDANGVYRVGDALKPPAREGVPQYPPDARAAGIKGVVLTEIVIDPSGNVADARVVRSVPMLDDAALQAVRTWKFAPTIVNGQPVPVRMTVSVNFRP